MRRPGNLGNTKYWFNPPNRIIDWLFGHQIRPTGRVIEVEGARSAQPVYVDKTVTQGKSADEPGSYGWSRRDKVSIPMPEEKPEDAYQSKTLDLRPYL